MKGVFIILDGVADEKLAALGYKTPLEYAKTPNLDHIARKSFIDHCYTVKEGVIPESSAAVVSLLGHDPTLSPRGPLEALGTGVKISHGDLAFRCNFATLESLESGKVLDSRAGRTLSNKEAAILAKAVNKGVKLPFKFEFKPTVQHRGVLIFRGGFSDNITGTDPFYANGAVVRGKDELGFSKPLDDDEESRIAAETLNSFTRQAFHILDKHPINKERVKKGLYSANVVLSRDPGSEAAKLKKLKGSWMALGYNPLEIGIARACKMNVYRFKYPKMKSFDVYDNLNVGLKKAIKHATKVLKRNRNKFDYFYIHFKETDLPGHDNKPFEKVKMIELIDRRFFSFLNGFMGRNPGRLVITADHTTSCRLKGHTSDPVPVLFYDSGIKEHGKRFTEEHGLEGRKIQGRKLLEKTLFK